MPSTLHSAPVAAVVDRLLADEQRQDQAAFAAAEVDSTAAFPTELDVAELADRMKDVFMSVSREGGELLYALARASRARTVVEFGASFGVSTLYLASAVRDNGGGRVITTELEPGKARHARDNVAAAGLDDLVELRLGDARETLRELPEPVDLVLLDGWPQLRLPVLRLVQTRLRPGALVLADDIDLDFGPGINEEFLGHVGDPANGYLSLRLPVADGVQVCVKLG